MASTKATPRPKLTYFKVKALAEPIRFILSYGGVNWEDYRFEREEWPTVKQTMPFGKVPVLEINGKTIHQSLAICRYLAQQFELVGETPCDALQIDIAVDTMDDVRSLCADYFKNKFLGCDEATEAKLKSPLMEDVLPFYFPKFEEMVKENNGYFVNGKLTWADLYWAAACDSWAGAFEEDILKDYPHLDALQKRVFALPAIKAWIDKRPKTNY